MSDVTFGCKSCFHAVFRLCFQKGRMDEENDLDIHLT